MSNLTANVYGIGSSRKDSNPNLTTTDKTERSAIGKGQHCIRYVGADAANHLVYAEVWVRDAANMAANETVTLTVKAG